MTYNETILEIRDLIGQDDLHAAIILLRNLLDSSEKLDEAIIQSAKLNEVKREIRSGTISVEGANLKLDKIRSNILDLLRDIEELVESDKKIQTEVKGLVVQNDFQVLSTFKEWRSSKLGRRTSSIVYFLVILFLLNILADLFFNKDNNEMYPFFEIVSHSLQFAFLIYVILTAWKYKKFTLNDFSNEKISNAEKEIRDNLRLYRPTEALLINEEQRQKKWIEFKLGANKASQQFSAFWLILWLTWILLYITFGLKEVYKNDENILWFSVIENFFNNGNTLLTAFLFLTVTISTSKIPVIKWLRWSLILVGFTLVEIILINLFESHQYEIDFSIKFITGIIATLVFMAFIGRLSNKFLNIPLGILFILYTYVIVQFLYPLFNFSEIALSSLDNPDLDIKLNIKNLDIGISFFALISKAVLFLTITWLLQTGKVLYFVIQESSLNFKRDDEFERMLRHVPIEEAHL